MEVEEIRRNENYLTSFFIDNVSQVNFSFLNGNFVIYAADFHSLPQKNELMFGKFFRRLQF